MYTAILRSCAPYAPINSSKYLCFERSLLRPGQKCQDQDRNAWWRFFKR
ncbi:MAG: hypothetical protein LBJ16_04230 [Holosporaceae bacterium]|nr:hypothetical protein [Holosporaceae bacterium]